MKFKRKESSDAVLLSLYSGMLYPRLIENKMLKLLRQGRISKWFSGIGQEAISVGTTMALHQDEYIFPLHRNLGVFTSRMVPLDRLIGQWQGKATGFTKGRDRSFHFGSLDHKIVGMISHLGPQLSLATGVALSHRLRTEGRVALVFTGEGGTSEGEFHEALNLAAVWKLPVVFVIENNGYALSTPVSEQYTCKNLVDRAKGYGMAGEKVDGNNVLEVYQTTAKWVERIRREPQPVLLECMTFRMRGHEEASGTKYVPDETLLEWEAKDPIQAFEEFLTEEGLLTESYKNSLTTDLMLHINQAVEVAFSQPDIVSSEAEQLADVYAPATTADVPEPKAGARPLRMVDALREALDQAMERDTNLVLMGQDIAAYGGVFKVTEGLSQRYGTERVRNTPLCESAVVGAAIGLSFEGIRSMVEMQFSDFVSCAFNQIVNNLAKMHYRWGHAPMVTIRMPTGGQVGAGPFHSQSTETWFVHTPGLKIVYPSNAFDAKGLLLSALNEPNPVLFFEHKYLYRSGSVPVPEEPYELPIGKAVVVRSGLQATVVTYGLGVHWAVDAVDEMQADIEIIDLRTLAPLDHDTVLDSVKKTGRLLILHECTLTAGIGAELAAQVVQSAFEYLDAPVMRCGALDTPVPFASGLEALFLPKNRLTKQLVELLNY